MEMLVGVDVVEGETGCAKRLELRPDLPRQLTSDLRQKEKTGSSARHIRVERGARADETRDFCRWQKGKAVDKNEMEADP